MKRILLAAIFATTSLAVSAQTDTTQKRDTAFYKVEQVPEFPGGLGKFGSFISKNLKYPKGETVEGRVIISFIVEKDGSLTDIKIKESLSEATDAEAIRLMKTSRKWKPGMQGGHPVRVQFSVPIAFRQNI